jgi:Putative addiction module component
MCSHAKTCSPPAARYWIAATPESIPVPDWHREILDERLKDLEPDLGAGDSWDVVQERLRKKFDSSH